MFGTLAILNLLHHFSLSSGGTVDIAVARGPGFNSSHFQLFKRQN